MGKEKGGGIRGRENRSLFGAQQRFPLFRVPVLSGKIVLSRYRRYFASYRLKTQHRVAKSIMLKRLRPRHQTMRLIICEERQCGWVGLTCPDPPFIKRIDSNNEGCI